MPSKKKTKLQAEQDLRNLVEGRWRENYKENLREAVGHLADPFPFLIALIREEGKGALHASWCLGIYAADHLDQAREHISDLIALCVDLKHDGKRKELLRVLRDLTPHEASESTLFDLSLTYLSDPSFSKAVHYFSLDIAYLTVLKYPELKGEYDLVIAEAIKWGSGPFCAKANRHAIKLKKKAAFTK